MSELSNTEFSPRLGNKLERLRESIGMSQGQFADFLGYSHRGYINYERNIRDTPAALVQVLYAKMGVDPAWLLVGEEDSPRKLAIRKVDPKALARVVEIMDDWLAENKDPVDSAKRAQIISLAYDVWVSEGTAPEKILDSLMSAAA